MNMSKAMLSGLSRGTRFCVATAVAGALFYGLLASAQALGGTRDRGAAITIVTRAELILAVGGTAAATVLVPAVHVVAGDVISYTLQIRNDGSSGVDNYSFTSPIPAHTAYIADSAVAPGAVVAFSVDGGNTFDAAENLRVPSPRGRSRRAEPADYTHIRWTLRNRLNAGSTALARFRARVVG